VAAGLVLLATWLAVTALLPAAASAAASPASAATCTDNWVGPASGTSSWATAADWSAGVPNGSSVPCIKKAGTYTVQATTSGEAAAAIMVGGAASGAQTLKIDGMNLPITQSSEVLKGGVLSLTPTSSAGAVISATGSTVSLTIAHGGKLSSAGASSHAADIATPVFVNHGTVTLAAASNTDNAGTTTDAGSFTVAAGAALTASSTNFTHSSGTLAAHGTFNNENLFTQSGGKETGNPVVQHAGTFVDSAGTGSFTIDQTSFEGNVPAGQTVTAQGSDLMGTSTAGVTVDGTLNCVPPDPGSCDLYTTGDWPGITVASGGTLETSGPGDTADDVFADLGANMNIQAGGTLTIANPATTVNTYTLTNSGTWQVAATGYISIGGSCDTTSTGTIDVTTGTGVTVADGGTILQNSGEFNNSGTLAVDTVGSEDGVTETVIDAKPGVGAFSNVTFTPPADTYTVTYTSTEVQLTLA
jgi:hypothetical protein